MSDTKLWQVSELTQALKEIIEDSFFPFWLTGEVGNLTVHRSGHVYFTLKDSRSQISAVYFSGARTVVDQQIREGTEVEVYGSLTVYEARGSYQISVQKMRPCGLGKLMLEFEALKEKLLQEGLFNDSRKRKIPLLPEKIAIITSIDGAALRDFLNIVDRRFSNIHIRIFPCAVQGKKAAEQVAQQVKNVNFLNAADVIIITRGGGSLEDLWGFNDELLARAIAASNIPVISAIGHEVDFTICDFVADLRVPTPSAAAELVIGQKVHFEEQLRSFERRLHNNLALKVSRMRQRLQLLTNAAVLKDPYRLLNEKQQLLDELSMRMERIIEKQLDISKNKFQHLQLKLRLLNPLQILDRGYAIVKYNGVIQTDPNLIPDQAMLSVRLAKGEITVEKKAKL